MKKAVIPIIVFIFIICSFFSFYLFKGRVSTENIIFDAFKNTGTAIRDSQASLSGKSDSKNLTTLEGARSFFNEIFHIFVTEGSFKLNTIDDIELTGFEAAKTIKGKGILSLKMVRQKKFAFGPYYVNLNLLEEFMNNNTGAAFDRAEAVFRRYGIRALRNFSMTGFIPGKTDRRELNDLISKIFYATSAEKVSSMSEKNLVSVTAYAPLLGGAVAIDGRRVNLNFASRYNSYENKTYIWLATPLITTEY